MKIIRIAIPIAAFFGIVVAYTVFKIVIILPIGLGGMVLLVLAMNPGSMLDRVMDRGARWCAFTGCLFIASAFLPVFGNGTSLLIAGAGSLILCFAVRVNSGRNEGQEGDTVVRRSRTLYYSARTDRALTALRCDPKNPGPEVLDWERYGMAETQTVLMQIGEEFTVKDLYKMRTPYVLGYSSALKVAGDKKQMKDQISSLQRDVLHLEIYKARLEAQLENSNKENSSLFAQVEAVKESEDYWKRRALERENDLLCIQGPEEDKSFNQLSDVEVYQLCEKMTGKAVAQMYGTNESAVSRRRAKGRQILDSGRS